MNIKILDRSHPAVPTIIYSWRNSLHQLDKETVSLHKNDKAVSQNNL